MPDGNQLVLQSCMEDSIVCSWSLDDAATGDVPQFVATDTQPCEIQCTSAEAIGRVQVMSSAKSCELRTADPTGAYITTVRGVEEADGKFSIEVDVQVLESLP
jgi:hypothetical protein